LVLSEQPEDDEVVRRKALAEGVGFVLNSYLSSRSLLNPAGMAANALNQFGGQGTDDDQRGAAREEAQMRAMVSQIQNLRATFEEGNLVVHMDMETVLELVENALKKRFAASEAGMTATFKIDTGANQESDHEAELVLPSRSIFLKVVPNGRPLAEFAVTYLMRAQSVNPSEYWLLTPNEELIDFPFEPIFTENKIVRGRMRSYPLPGLLGEIVGEGYVVSCTYDVDGGFRFVISSKPKAAPPVAEPPEPSTAGP